VIKWIQSATGPANLEEEEGGSIDKWIGERHSSSIGKWTGELCSIDNRIGGHQRQEDSVSKWTGESRVQSAKGTGERQERFN
jgi:hypothetical protein